MKGTVESTNVITIVNGVRCREWRGATEAGTPLKMFVFQCVTFGEERFPEMELVPGGEPQMEDGGTEPEMSVKDGGTGTGEKTDAT